MTDIKTVEERSRNMSRIRNKDTGPEVWLRKELFSAGYRYRKNVKSLPGCPDIWMAKYSTAVFVNGCFWHRHQGCRYAYVPKSRIEFWTQKFAANIERDARVEKELLSTGIRVVIVWECSIKKMMKSEEKCTEMLALVRSFLNSDQRRLEI